MNKEQLKIFLQNYGLRPNFTYGQNFLIDDMVLRDMADAAEVSSADRVLEIGPGIGNLTRLLCDRAGFVLSVEKDPKFYPVLRAIKKDYKNNFRFEIADILEFDFQKALNEVALSGGTAVAPGPSPADFIPYKVVANIPYYITGKILQLLMSAKNKPSSVTVLTQKEVARNIVAGPGNLSVLAISVQLYGTPQIKMPVPAKSFYPAPKVDSAVLKIDLFDKPKFEIGDEKKFFWLLRGCFAGKRKQLHNTLEHNLGLTKEKAGEVLSALGLSPAARPQQLSIEQWAALNKML